MKTSRYISMSLFGCLLLSEGCADDLVQLAPDDDGGRVKVVLYVPYADGSANTRANPQAGEDGNGREQGMANENALYDVNLFFFHGSGLNPSDAGIPVAGVFIPSLEGVGVLTEALPYEKKVTVTFNAAETSLSGTDILNADTDVSFITVINAGKDLYTEGMTLGSLRELILEGNTWTASEEDVYDATKSDRFLMTTAYDADTDGNVDIDGISRKVGSGRLIRTDIAEGYSTDAKPEWHGETTVQRMCARIDVMYQDAVLECEGNEASLVYSLVGHDKTGDLVHITNILPVNVMQKPSYLLTKVTYGIPTAWTESGLGSITWGGTEKKTSSNLPANYVIEPHTLLKEAGSINLSDDWYGESRKTSVINRIQDDSNGKVGDYFSDSLSGTEDDSYYSEKGYTKMTVIGYANENIQSPEASVSDFLTGLVFRALYQPRKWSSRVDGTWLVTEMTDADWMTLKDKSFTLYSPTAGGSDAEVRYFSKHTDAEEYKRSNPNEQAVLTRYEGGVCYFNLWLRHYFDEKADYQGNYPMEYAIVRNNIYRVALTFSGPGSPKSEMREPDTMMSRIFVKKWNLRKESSMKF